LPWSQEEGAEEFLERFCELRGPAPLTPREARAHISTRAARHQEEDFAYLRLQAQDAWYVRSLVFGQLLGAARGVWLPERYWTEGKAALVVDELTRRAHAEGGDRVRVHLPARLLRPLEGDLVWAVSHGRYVGVTRLGAHVHVEDMPGRYVLVLGLPSPLAYQWGEGGRGLRLTRLYGEIVARRAARVWVRDRTAMFALMVDGAGVGAYRPPEAVE
jgi:hypothetical protein